MLTKPEIEIQFEVLQELKRSGRILKNIQKARIRLELQGMGFCRSYVVSGSSSELSEAERKAELKAARELYIRITRNEVEHEASFFLGPLSKALEPLYEEEEARKKTIAKWSQELPPFDLRGFGPVSYGQLIAHTGDLRAYSNPARVWKRMGLAVMPDGTRQRKIAGTSPEAKQAAIEHGYDPWRRSFMFVVGENLIKSGSPLKQVYDDRKVYEAQRNPDKPKMFCHMRAKRYMEKRLLVKVWEVWHGVS